MSRMKLRVVALAVVTAGLATAGVTAAVAGSHQPSCRYTAIQVRDQLQQELNRENAAIAVNRTTDNRAALKSAVQRLTAACA